MSAPSRGLAAVHRLRHPDEMLAAMLRSIGNRIAENLDGKRHDEEETIRALRGNLGTTIEYVDQWLENGEPGPKYDGPSGRGGRAGQ